MLAGMPDEFATAGLADLLADLLTEGDEPDAQRPCSGRRPGLPGPPG